MRQSTSELTRKKVERARKRRHDPAYQEQSERLKRYKLERQRQKREDPDYWQKELEKMYERRRKRFVQSTVAGPDKDKIAEVVAEASSCAICGKETKLHIDHCHRTNFVRGMLCFRCNTALGKFCDDPKLLERAADYLRNSPVLARKIRYHRRWAKRKPHLEQPYTN